MIIALVIGVIGLLCVYLEFFVPGGLLALLGFVLLLVSSVFCFLKVDSLGLCFTFVLFLLAAAIFVCYLALKHLKKSGSKNSFFLQKSQKGYCSEKIEDDLLGKEGVVSTELKPSGHVRIEGKVYQASSQGPFIAKGQTVEVIQVAGARLIVKVKKEDVE